MKNVQLFSKEYLEQCRAMSPDDIASFLDQFRQLHSIRHIDDIREKSSKNSVSIDVKKHKN